MIANLDRLTESLQQLKRLNSREMMLPGQQPSSFISNALLLRAMLTEHLPLCYRA